MPYQFINENEVVYGLFIMSCCLKVLDPV